MALERSCDRSIHIHPTTDGMHHELRIVYPQVPFMIIASVWHRRKYVNTAYRTQEEVAVDKSNGNAP